MKRTRASDEINEAWNYPLFRAIWERRARRFPIGAEWPNAFTPYVSKAQVTPLNGTELALLIWAGVGNTGHALGDLPFVDVDGATLGGNTMLSLAGKSFASPCGSYGTALCFTNDDGTFYVDPRRLEPPGPSQSTEPWIDQESLSKILASSQRIGEGRLPIPMDFPTTLKYNQWNVNKPGTVLFMPISDVTRQYINGLMLAIGEPHGYYVYDDFNSNAEPLRKYVGTGRLTREHPWPLSDFERLQQTMVAGVEQSLICQNMFLALQAMGLGGWIFSPSEASTVFRLMGFESRSVPRVGLFKPPSWADDESESFVGLPGLLEVCSPPFFSDMRQAVRAVVDEKWGNFGLYTEEQSLPYRDTSAFREGVPRYPNWVIEATQDFCEYIWATYGRFPAAIDPVQMTIWFQAHHLETDFYDRYYNEGTAYPPTIAAHLDRWHRS